VRFSLKWILAGMVYVAIAAAAFGTGKWYFGDALWALTLLVVVYAILGVVISRGRRLGALGFVVGAAVFGLCLTYGSDSVPTVRLLVAAGIEPTLPPVELPYSRPIMPGVAVAPAPIRVIDFPAYLRAANAVATMAFGLMGSLVGLMAFRASAKGRDGEYARGTE
jgi:hypothetical protein